MGYLWALLHNASCVFDLDDDNELHGPIPWAEALMAGSEGLAGIRQRHALSSWDDGSSSCSKGGARGSRRHSSRDTGPLASSTLPWSSARSLFSLHSTEGPATAGGFHGAAPASPASAPPRSPSLSSSRPWARSAAAVADGRQLPGPGLGPDSARPVPPNSSTGFRLLLLPQHKGRVLNPYPLFQPSHLPLWPRGFPLAAVKDPGAYASLAAARPLRWDAFSNPASAGHGARGVVGVVQILAQHEPDVDAVYRMTLPLPVTFHVHHTPGHALTDSKPHDSINSQTSAGVRMDHLSLLLLPPRCLAPLNAQATLFLQPTLWALLLPASVHGRVTDIWRGYLAQRLMWEVRGLRTAFASPWVTHVRSSYHISTRGFEKEAGEKVPRSHVADMVAEQDLYYRAGQLVSFLSSWQCADVPVRHTTVRVRRRITAGQQPASLSECVLQLWREMYERGYIEEQDVRLAQLWLQQLQQIAGYTLPARASL